jgi:hypothetical protein
MQVAKEAGRSRWAESQAGRQLHEHGTELGPECCNLPEEPGKRLLRILKAAAVGDLLRHLHGEAETCRNRLGPALVGARTMRTVEGRVDLDGGQATAAAAEMVAVRGKASAYRAGMDHPAVPTRNLPTATPTGVGMGK